MDWQGLTLFLYIVARVSGFVLFNPLLGRNNIPGIFRAGFVLVVSVFVVIITDQTVPVPTLMIQFSLRILMEFLLGFALGMVVNFVFSAPQLAGLMIDTQMGMTMNQIYDAGSHTSMSLTGSFLNAAMILLFFAANGHHTLMRILITSGEGIPFGSWAVDFSSLAAIMLELFIECTILGVKLCMPILAADLIGQLGMGVLMKAIPQINVFAINIELKVIIGLAMLLLLISPFTEFLLGLEMNMLDSMEQVLKLAG